MRFKLFSNAFINIPTVVDDGDTRYTKTVATRISHEDGSTISPAAPRVMDFPSDLPLDSISRRWEALDDEAKAAQAKLSKATSNLAGLDKFEAPEEVKVDAASVLAAIGSLSDEEKAKLIGALGGKSKTVEPAKPVEVKAK